MANGSNLVQDNLKNNTVKPSRNTSGLESWGRIFSRCRLTLTMNGFLVAPQMLGL